MSLCAVRNSVLGSKLMFLTDDTWFHLSECINTQNNRYLSKINLRQTSELPPSQSQDLGVVCRYCYTKIRVIFFKT
jgi:hypothetical protein